MAWSARLLETQYIGEDANGFYLPAVRIAADALDGEMPRLRDMG